MGLNWGLSLNIELTESFFCVQYMPLLYFPTMCCQLRYPFWCLKKIPLEDLRYSMDGLECFSVQALEQRIIPVLKKWFQSQVRQKIKNNNNCQLCQDRGLTRILWSSNRQGRYLGSQDRLHWDSTHASSRTNDLGEEIVWCILVVFAGSKTDFLVASFY